MAQVEKRFAKRRVGTFDTCQHVACQKEYKVAKQWQRFCSPACCKKAFRDEDTWQGSCPKCGNHIVVMQADNQKGLE